MPRCITLTSAGVLGFILFVTTRTATANNILNFDNLTGSLPYSQGTPVPVGDRLSTQYQNSFGILFTSNAGYVGVGQFGTDAPSAPNVIAGTSIAGNFDYGAPVTFSFWNPGNISQMATTNFFSVQGDLSPVGSNGQMVTVAAYDVNGVLLGTDTETDTGGEVWALSFPGIHSVVFPGATNVNPGGIGLDNVTFGSVVAVPEPAIAIFALAVAPLMVRNRRRA